MLKNFKEFFKEYFENRVVILKLMKWILIVFFCFNIASVLLYLLLRLFPDFWPMFITEKVMDIYFGAFIMRLKIISAFLLKLIFSVQIGLLIFACRNSEKIFKKC